MPVDVIVDGKDNATAVLDAVTQKITGMSGLVGRSEAQIRQDYRETRQDVRLNASALTTLGMAYKADNMEAFAFTGALARTGAVMGQVNRAFQQYTVMQIREQDAARNVTDAQSRYNETVERYGRSSSQAISAQKALNQAQEQASQVQQQNSAGIAGLIIQLGTQLPQAILASAQAWSQFQKIGGMSGLVTNFGNLATSVGTTVPTIAGLAASLTILALGFQQNQKEQKEVQTQTGLTADEMWKLQYVVGTTELSIKQINDRIKDGTLDISNYGEAYQIIQEKIKAGLGAYATEPGTWAQGKFIPTPPVAEPNYAYQNYLNQLDAEMAKINAQSVSVTITADTTGAESGIAAVNNAINSIPESKTVTIYTIMQDIASGVSDFFLGKHYASGGIVPGHGPQLAVVHGGEEILTQQQQNTNMHTTMFNNIYNMTDWNRTLRRFDSYVVGKVRSR